MSVEELTVSPIHEILVNGGMVFLDHIHVLRTYFLGTSIASMPVVLLQFLVNLLPFIRLRTHLLVLGQLRSNMSEDMLGTYHVFVVGEFVLVHDRCDGHVDGCTSITVEYNVRTFAQSCLHQGREKK